MTEFKGGEKAYTSTDLGTVQSVTCVQGQMVKGRCHMVNVQRLPKYAVVIVEFVYWCMSLIIKAQKNWRDVDRTAFKFKAFAIVTFSRNL